MYSQRLVQINGLAANSMMAINSSGTAIKSTALTVTSGGAMQLPLNSIVLADKTSSTANVTGDGTDFQVIFPTVRTQQGSSYNNATGLFTAATAGVFLIAGFVTFGAIGTGMTLGGVFIKINSLKYACFGCSPLASRDANLNLALPFQQMFYLAAGDTAAIIASISGGTKTVSIFGSAAPVTTLSITQRL